jgi:hypothetical protein
MRRTTVADLDERFGRFRAGPPLVVPAGPAAARRVIAHRRRVSTVASCLLAAVAVGLPSVAFAAGAFDRTPHPPAVTDQPAPTRTPHPSTPPPTRGRTQPPEETPSEPIVVPAEAMLRESDLPPGYRSRPASKNGDWTLAATASRCVDRRPAGTTPDYRAASEIAFLRGRDEPLLQTVFRMATPDDARRWLDGLPDRLGGDCGRMRFAVVDSGFAGERSVIIRVTAAEGEPNLYLFLQRGVLLTEIWEKHQTDVDAMRELGRKAADRLCAGTPAC